MDSFFFFFLLPEPVFWYYVKEVLNKHELQRFYSLKTITTDIGRGRAWLRCALNEHSLERYVHMLLADKNRLRYCIRCHCNAGNVHVLTNEIWRFKKQKQQKIAKQTKPPDTAVIIYHINCCASDAHVYCVYF